MASNWASTLKKFEKYTSKNTLENTLNKAGKDLNKKIEKLNKTSNSSLSKFDPSVNYSAPLTNTNQLFPSLDPMKNFDTAVKEYEKQKEKNFENLIDTASVNFNINNYYKGSLQSSLSDLGLNDNNLNTVDLNSINFANTLPSLFTIENTTTSFKFTAPTDIFVTGNLSTEITTTEKSGFFKTIGKATKTFVTESIPSFIGKIIEAADFNAVYKSNMVSFEHVLTGLDERANPKNNKQDWGDFFSEVFSTDTIKEIGSTVLNALKDGALNYAKDFLNIGFRFKKKSENGYLYPGQSYGNMNFLGAFKTNKYYFPYTAYDSQIDIGRGIDYSAFDFISDIIGSIKYVDKQKTPNPDIFSSYKRRDYLFNYGGYLDQLELAITEKLGFNIKHPIIDTSDTYSSVSDLQDQSELFKNWISKNPLLGQHQFNMSIGWPWKDSTKKNVDLEDPELDLWGTYVEDDLGNEYGNHAFRIKDLSIPEINRSTTSINYGASLISTFQSLQPKSKNIMTFTIICDRNLSLLEYLINLSGLGIKEEGEPNGVKYRAYNLSTVVTDNNDTNNMYAWLEITPGRELTKELNFEERSWSFDSNGPTSEKLGVNYNVDTLESTTSVSKDKVLYADCPTFNFENFKIINLDYNFKFESKENNDASLFEIKATASWSKLYLEYM